MSNKTWKRIWCTLIVVLLILISGGVYFYYQSTRNEITGKEYLEKQADHMDEFEFYADSLDNVVALYLNGNIGEQDFLNHLSVFQQELEIMKSAYQKEKELHPVKIGSHTYATKKGSEAIEECYKIYDNLLTMLEENAGEKETLSYKYIAFHQDIIGALADYMTAVEEEDSNE